MLHSTCLPITLSTRVIFWNVLGFILFQPARNPGEGQVLISSPPQASLSGGFMVDSNPIRPLVTGTRPNALDSVTENHPNDPLWALDPFLRAWSPQASSAFHLASGGWSLPRHLQFGVIIERALTQPPLFPLWLHICSDKWPDFCYPPF